MIEIPLSPDGERTVAVNVGARTLVFRTYFAPGEKDHWLLDIQDDAESPLVSGINLVPGVGNLLKGQGDKLAEWQAFVDIRPGTDASDMEAPGNTLVLLWAGIDEEVEAWPTGDVLTDGLETRGW